MGLTRKRKRELKKLQGNAERLWEEQRDVLDHASHVIREARRQAGNFAREEVSPKVVGAYEARLKPVVSSTRDRVSDVVPAVTSVVGSAVAVLNAVRDPHLREALLKTAKKAPPKPSFGAGRIVLIGVGVLAAAGLAYAVWQTLRADDDLWVEDQPEETHLDDI
ncbi:MULTISPECIES: DNA helicase [unclassified Salinibacterium]|uniref:DNA helicase n=1 Tax=unclassified Salinibacterium TaxID=2632331 RepID=UPI001420F5C5|nr:MULTISPECIES: DNA helicase [unclassified Salinibacterium]